MCYRLKYSTCTGDAIAAVSGITGTRVAARCIVKRTCTGDAIAAIPGIAGARVAARCIVTRRQCRVAIVGVLHTFVVIYNKSIETDGKLGFYLYYVNLKKKEEKEIESEV